VDREGQRIAHHILAWAETESGGDIDELLLKVADLPYIATRLNGQTHYLVAPIGPGPGDFLQIEVEQLQEVQDRRITAPDWFPDSIAEFVDPLDFPHLEPRPLGPPRLLFRRLLRVPDFMASREAGPRLQRFVRDWERCSAQESAHFSEHWVLAIRESQNRKGATHLGAKPIPILAGEIPPLPDGEVARGALLANRIHGFDRALGYPFAWYFHMLTSPKVSHRLAEAVHADLMGATPISPPGISRSCGTGMKSPMGSSLPAHFPTRLGTSDSARQGPAQISINAREARGNRFLELPQGRDEFGAGQAGDFRGPTLVLLGDVSDE
ncbi:MAG: hypothetical protein KBE53_02970, partial [Chromatiaceae bacterium]|nr:hypothetical protein [Chromatiaceae bacterium]